MQLRLLLPQQVPSVQLQQNPLAWLWRHLLCVWLKERVQLEIVPQKVSKLARPVQRELLVQVVQLERPEIPKQLPKVAVRERREPVVTTCKASSRKQALNRATGQQKSLVLQ